MFDLLREEQEVIDAPGAGPLTVKRGAVEFNNVTFGYLPERLVLKNVTFTVPTGQTVALVCLKTLLNCKRECHRVPLRGLFFLTVLYCVLGWAVW